MRRSGWLLAALFALAWIGSAAAADSWVVTDVHGAVLALVGDEWREVSSGDRIASGIAVRTLQAGSATLRRGDEELGLAANTVVRPTAAGGHPMVEQYTGVVTLVETGGTGARRPPPPAALYVRGGEAHLSVDGRRLLLRAGQGYSLHGNWSGVVIPATDGTEGQAAPAATAPDAGAGGGPPVSDGAAGSGPPGGGPGPAGGSGNSGPNGNPSGTASPGGPSGHAGGNGNSGKGPK